ncbi:hypothetical protein Rru_A0424 [Rhodospirillum rubrum ATCC 11170]|uniref:DUF3096 domain-containing protein n=1 Tax=Rhodospirillum rubrum (strain ATCC 11170 / ATH 1.1.1 / DSM 467 / LMG 4362 / NCIMB 8255 / S1) TaxID=269796 RepID=Q2RXB6_RHORT|nr:hypothetical protein Rru_A0424 [Rhodospirillum rubrum ATCC 11170]MBK5952781.1 hypothetical protein [Rhodospirillum rubrum]
MSEATQARHRALIGTLPPSALRRPPMTFTMNMALLSPLIALLAGILILVMPRLLNFVVAIYLILIGIIGLAAYF